MSQFQTLLFSFNLYCPQTVERDHEGLQTQSRGI